MQDQKKLDKLIKVLELANRDTVSVEDISTVINSLVDVIQADRKDHIQKTSDTIDNFDRQLNGFAIKYQELYPLKDQITKSQEQVKSEIRTELNTLVNGLKKDLAKEISAISDTIKSSESTNTEQLSALESKFSVLESLNKDFGSLNLMVKNNKLDTLRTEVEQAIKISEENVKRFTSLPPTTPFINGKRAKNINFTGVTPTHNGDTATVDLSSLASSVYNNLTINLSSATNNNYTISGLSSTQINYVTITNVVSGGATITGIAGGVAGMEIVLFNNDASGDSVVYANQSGSSSAGNRFLAQTDTTQRQYEVVYLRYDDTTSSWVLMKTGGIWQYMSGTQSSVNLSGFTNDVPFLSSVSHDSTLTGAGTSGSPLSAAKQDPKWNTTTVAAVQTAYAGGTALASGGFYYLSPTWADGYFTFQNTFDGGSPAFVSGRAQFYVPDYDSTIYNATGYTYFNTFTSFQYTEGNMLGVWTASLTPQDPTMTTLADFAIYNGLMYYNQTGTNTATDPATDTTNWVEMPKAYGSALGYTIEWDYVEWDYLNDWIIRRKDRRNNDFRASYVLFGAGTNPITKFQWGRNAVEGNTIIDIDINNINSSAAISYSMHAKDWFTIRGNDPSLDLYEDDASMVGGVYMSGGTLNLYTDASKKIRLWNDLDLQGVYISGQFVPDAHDSYDIGSSSKSWAGLYLGPDETIYFNNIPYISQGVSTDNNLYLTPPSSNYVAITDPTSSYNAKFDTSSLASSDKTFTFPNLSGTLAVVSSTANASSVYAGTYTPTRSAESNLDSNVTMTEAQYMRVGNTTTVSGRFTADPTATGATSFEITLPVASNIGAVEDVAGVAFSGGIAGQGAEIVGVVANDTAKVQWIAVDVTSQTWSYTFSYQVI